MEAVDGLLAIGKVAVRCDRKGHLIKLINGNDGTSSRASNGRELAKAACRQQARSMRRSRSRSRVFR
jgi:hypothetical protein